ncbi:MAG: hypothetical protein U0804_03950 [Gemmataceae bacterium]
MSVLFVGGPYDGRELDGESLYGRVPFERVLGDLGNRVFVLMPPPEAWDVAGGGNASSGIQYAYERVATPEGHRFEWRGQGGLEEARREAGLAIHPRAKTALSTFPPELQRDVVQTVAALLNVPPERWPSRGVMHLLDGKPIYLVTLPRSYRAFVRVRDDRRVELFDIFREETLRQFAEQYASAGVAG